MKKNERPICNFAHMEQGVNNIELDHGGQAKFTTIIVFVQKTT